MKLFCNFWLMFFFLLGSSLGQVVVSGKVLAEDGRPVAGALVQAFPIGEAGSGGNVQWIRTDQRAEFRLTLPKGRYSIRVKDEADGYPDPTFLLNRDPHAKFPTISVDAQDITGIQAILGNRGGVLRGAVQDKQSSKAIPNAKVRLQDAHNTNTFVEVFTDNSGQFQFTVPSKPILISITASGYKLATVQSGAEVLLSPGEERSMSIGMEHE